MIKTMLIAEFEYDELLMHGNDQEDIEWFWDVVLNTPLSVLSHEVGDVIGELVNVRVEKYNDT